MAPPLRQAARCGFSDGDRYCCRLERFRFGEDSSRYRGGGHRCRSSVDSRRSGGLPAMAFSDQPLLVTSPGFSDHSTILAYRALSFMTTTLARSRASGVNGEPEERGARADARHPGCQATLKSICVRSPSDARLPASSISTPTT